MGQHKVKKDRVCRHCGRSVAGTAKDIKNHFWNCKTGKQFKAVA